MVKRSNKVKIQVVNITTTSDIKNGDNIEIKTKMAAASILDKSIFPMSSLLKHIYEEQIWCLVPCFQD
jgi:hypothetical protein